MKRGHDPIRGHSASPDVIRRRPFEQWERGNDPLGTQMVWDILSWLLFIVFIAGLIIVGALLLKGYLAQGSNAAGFSGAFFGPKPDKRLEVVDQASVDGRRRLVLLRRDNVEHLIMIGGPVDVVIETGIEIATRTSASLERIDGDRVDGAEKPAAVVNRPARVFGKSAGEA
jgi:flagellar protein FliO/FliZ